MNAKSFPKLFDHTLLKPYASKEDIKNLCEDAKKFNFKSVAINNANIEKCIELLEGSDVLVDAAVSFPLGQCTLETKIFETKDAIEKGADEIDYVINIAELKDNNLKYIEKEMYSIVEICNLANITIKVIFENCYLSKEEKITLCKMANKYKPDFIKTSTGFGTSGATIEDITLMRYYTLPQIQIKAAGGIKNLDTVIKLLNVGATRIGCSSSVQIMEEFHNSPPNSLN